MANITINDASLGTLAAGEIANDDVIAVWDSSAGAQKKATRATVVGGTILNGGTLDLGGFTVTAQRTGYALTSDGTLVILPGATTFRVDNIAAGANALMRLHGTRTSGLTTNDEVRLLMSMSNSGNVAIDYAALGVAVDNFNGAGRLVFYTQVASGALTERGRFDSLGNFRVANLAGTGNRAVYSDATGNLTNTASDERLKTNVEPISPAEALMIVEALRAVRYDWQDQDAHGAQREIGLLAQEVQAVVPEVVGANADGMLSLDYAKLVAVLAGAVQALTARVAALEAQAG